MCRLTDLVLVIGSVHDADVFHRGRKLTDVTAKKHWLASLDCADDCRLELIARRIDVWKTVYLIYSRVQPRRRHSQRTGRPPQMLPSLSTV